MPDIYDDLANAYLGAKSAPKTETASETKKIAGYVPLNRTSGNKQIDAYYDKYGKDFDVDANLLFEQGYQESRFKNNARSHKGAVGPAQFLADTAREFGLRVDNEVDERLDPDKAIPAQAKLMRKLLDRTGDIGLSLAGYNSGHNYGVERLRQNIERITETKDYVKRITEKYGSNSNFGDPFENLVQNYLKMPKQANASSGEIAGDPYENLAENYLNQGSAPAARQPMQPDPVQELNNLRTDLENQLKSAQTKEEWRKIAESLKQLKTSISQTQAQIPTQNQVLPAPAVPTQNKPDPVQTTVEASSVKMPVAFQMPDGRTFVEQSNQDGLQPDEIRVRDTSNDKGGVIVVKKVLKDGKESYVLPSPQGEPNKNINQRGYKGKTNKIAGIGNLTQPIQQPAEITPTEQTAATDQDYNEYLAYARSSNVSPISRDEFEKQANSGFGRGVSATAEIDGSRTFDDNDNVQTQILQKGDANTPEVRLEKPDTKVNLKEANLQNIENSYAGEFNFKIITPSSRQLSADEAIAQSFAQLPRNVRETAEVYQKITGRELWYNNPEDKAIYQQMLDETGAVNLKYPINRVVQSFVDAYASGGEESLRKAIENPQSSAYQNYAADVPTASRKFDANNEKSEAEAEKRVRESLQGNGLLDAAGAFVERGLESLNPITALKRGFGQNDDKSDIQREIEDQEELDTKAAAIKKQYGSFENYEQKLKNFDDLDPITKTGEYWKHFGNVFVQGLVDMGKALPMLDKLEEKYNPLNLVLPEKYRISLSNVGNAIAYISGSQAPAELSSDAVENGRIYRALNDFKKEYTKLNPFIQNSTGGEIGSGVVSALQFFGVGMAFRGSKLATALAGGMMEAPSQYEQMRERGVNPDSALLWSQLVGYPLGATELVGIGGAANSALAMTKLGSELSESGAKTFLRSIVEFSKNRGKDILSEAPEEGLQEWFQSSLGQSAIEALSKQNPKDGDRVLEFFAQLPKQFGKSVPTALTAAVTGGIFGAGVGAATDAQNSINDRKNTPLAKMREFEKKTFDTSKIQIGNEVFDAADNVRAKLDESVDLYKEANRAWIEGQKLLAQVRKAPNFTKKKELLRESAKQMQLGNKYYEKSESAALEAEKLHKNEPVSAKPKEPVVPVNEENTELPATENIAENQTATGKPELTESVDDDGKIAAGNSEKNADNLKTVSHSNPAIDGKPIISETAGGKAVVANSQNKSGVSIVTNRKNQVQGLSFEDSSEDSQVKEEKTKKVPTYSFSSTQVNLPESVSNEVLSVGKKLIPDSELYIDENDPSYGREENPHITVKYGLHTEDTNEVRNILANEKPFEVTLGKISIFPGKEGTNYDVVKADVESAELHRINKLIADNTQVTDTFPEYKPHVTLAYVKKGEGQKYVGNSDLEGKKLTFDSIAFSPKNGEMVEIPLKGQSKPIDAGDEIKAFFSGFTAENITQDLRDKLWNKVQKGDTTELGKTSNILIAAKKIRERGGLQEREEFEKFNKDYFDTVANKTGAELQSAGNALIKRFLPKTTNETAQTAQVSSDKLNNDDLVVLTPTKRETKETAEVKNTIESTESVDSETVESELNTDREIQNKAHDIISELYDEKPTTYSGKNEKVADALKGLAGILGDDILLKAAVLPESNFDEKQYEQTKPLLKTILDELGDPADNTETSLRKIITTLKNDYNLSKDGVIKLVPYMSKYLLEAKNNLQKPENESKNNLEAKNDGQRTKSENDGDSSNADEITSDVSGNESERDTGDIRSTKSGSSQRNARGTDASSDRQNRDDDRSVEVDSGAEPVESASGGNSDRTSDGISDGIQPKRDYLAPIGSLVRAGSWRETAKTNLDILELVKKLEKENRLATAEEQQLLVKFTGWGASEIANNLFPGAKYYGEIRPEQARDGWKDLAERAKNLFTPEELQTALRSTQYAHYTSESIVRGIWDALTQFGFNQGKILEPGMGIGLFGVAAPRNILENSRYTGIEMDKMTAAVAKQVLQNQAVISGDFVKQKLPNDFFDVAIGNPPFSSTKILDDPAYKKYRFLLHDYFFAKSIDKVRPGGLLVFVTSKGTMDKGDQKMREYIAERADLLGAIRLPQTAFKQNAGTEVVTDVIFLRKRLDGELPAGEAWIKRDEIEAANKSGDVVKGLINEYFVNHPEMVLGKNSFQGSMYRANEYTVEPLDGEIETHFKEAIEKLPTAVYANIAKSDEIVQKTAERDWDPKAKKEGSLYIHDNGTLMRRENGSGVALSEIYKLSANDQKWLKDYVGLRIALKTAQSDQLNDGEWEKSLKELNSVYDAFVKKHGEIVSFTSQERTVVDADGLETTKVTRRYKNSRLLGFDVESSLIRALERITEDNRIVKSAMLEKRTIKRPSVPEIKTLSDALAVSLDKLGTLNIAHIAEIYKPIREMTKDEVIAELGDAVFESPSGGYQLSDEYLSGHVIDKLEEAQAAASVDKKFDRNVKALLKVQPKPLEPLQINVGLGAAWVPAKVISQFAQEVIQIGRDTISFDPITHLWTVEGAEGSGSRSNRTASADWGTADRSPQELLDAALNNKSIRITYKSDGKTFLDEKASAVANELVKKMRDTFRGWVWTDATRGSELAAKYNRQFNNIAPRSFNGKHLSLPGLSAVYNLHDHQARAVWRILQSGNTYLAHAVGAGKTLEMIVSGMEQKRLGLINKPMYVVPNHMLNQFASEFLDAYPLANILVADEKNFHKENRRRFVAQAALNDLDAVVITHSAFGLLRTKPETSAKVVDDMISQLNMAIDELDENDRAEKRTIKKLEARKEMIERRFYGKSSDEGRDDVVDFEDLGVDFLFVDEAHEFRKLDFVTNRDSVKGITPEGSRRALDLLIKMRWLEQQRPGRSAVLASGTPVTNTLAELYSIMRFLDNAELEAAGISHFDAWANQFGEVVGEYEMNAAGNYELVERFSKFINIPELMKRVRKFMDVLTLNQLGSLVDLPTMKGGIPQVIVVPATEATTNYLKGELDARIKISRDWKPTKDQPGNPDPLINIITDGRLSAIDMRFVDRNAPNDPNSKLNLMIDKMIKNYTDHKDLEFRHKVTGEVDPIKGAAQIVFSAVGFGEAVAANRGFDAKAWMIKRLTEAGIPASEIAFMSDYKSAISKEAMFQEMRQGTKRILIGSPKNMGTGVNVQKRLKNLEYLSPPWYPADVEQPDGRILRQGNQNEEIEITRWATKGTYDSTAWAMIARKSRAIEQAMTGDDSQRSLEDVSESSNYEMASALAAGDGRAIQLAGLRREVEKLTRLKDGHFQEQQFLQSEKRSTARKIESGTENLERLNNAVKAVGFVNSDNFNALFGNQTFSKRTEIGDAIKTGFTEALKKNKKKIIATKVPMTVEIGKALGKFSINANFYAGDYGFDADLVIKIGDVQRKLNDHKIEDISEYDSVGLATRIYNALTNVAKDKRDAESYLEESKRALKQINSKIGRPFAEEQDLYEKIAEYKQLQLEMAGEGKEKETEEESEKTLSDTELLKSIVNDPFASELKKLAPRIEKLSQEIDAFRAGANRYGQPFVVLDKPSVVLTKLGMDLKKIVISVGIVAKLGEKHNLSPNVVKLLPEELTDPVMVLQSSSQPDSLVVITSKIRKKDKKPIISAIHIEKQIGPDAVHSIKSVYAKDEISAIEKWINDGKVIYLNKNKSVDWIKAAGLQLPLTQIQQRSVNNLLTEQDFVNKDGLSKRIEDADYYSVREEKTAKLVEKADFAREGKNLKLNIEAQEILRRAQEQHDLQTGAKKLGEYNPEASFSGVFLKPETLQNLTRILRAAAADAQKRQLKLQAVKLNKFADEIEGLSKESKNTLVAYTDSSRIPHEIFHQKSFMNALAKHLTKRHKNPFQLSQMEETRTAYQTYFSQFPEYNRYFADGKFPFNGSGKLKQKLDTNQELGLAVIREEMAAYIAGGEGALLGLDADQEANYMIKFFDSYIAENARNEKEIDEILENFGENNKYVQKIIEQFKNSIAGNGRGSGESLPGEPAQITPGTKGSDESVFGESESQEESETGRLPGGTGDGKRKLRSLPENLRENGISAEDEFYDVVTDIEAKAQAREIIEKGGIDEALRVLKNTSQPDAVTAQLGFMVAQSIEDTIAETTDESELEKLRQIQSEFTSDLAKKFTKAGQFISAARVVKNSPISVVISAQAILKARESDEDASLSPEQIQQFEDLGKESARKSAALERVRRLLTNQRAKNKRLQDIIDGKSIKRTSGARKARESVVQLIKKKHGTSVAEKLAELRGKLNPARDIGLNKRIEVDLLKRVEEPENLDPETLKDLAEVGAMYLTEGIAASEDVYLPDYFHAQMTADFGNSIAPQMNEIYYESMKIRDIWLKEANFEKNKKRLQNKADSDSGREKMEDVLARELPEKLTDDDVYEILQTEADYRRKRLAVEQAHRLVSGARKTNATDEMTRTIAELSENPEIAAAAKIFADGNRDAKSFYRQMNALGFDSNKAKELFVSGKKLFNQAKAQIADNHAEIKEEIAENSALIQKFSDEEWKARKAAQKAQEEIANEFERLKKGTIRKIVGGIYNGIFDLTRNLNATGELSFMLKQAGRFLFGAPVRFIANAATNKNYELKNNFVEGMKILNTLPRILFNDASWSDLKTSGGWKQIGNWNDDTGFGRIMQYIEADPVFVEAAKMGVAFSAAGKMGMGGHLGEEQLSSPLTEKIMPVRRFDNAMSGFLDALRLESYKRMRENLIEQGFTPKKNAKEFELIAKEVNRGTGRANKFENAVGVQKAVDAIGRSNLAFAINYTISKYQMIGADFNNVGSALGNLIVNQEMPKGANREIVKNAVAAYSALSVRMGFLALALGATLSFDPDDDDFLKFKWGDYRYDGTFGFRSELKFIFKLMKSVAHGDRVPGEMLYDLTTTTGNYVRNKLNVLPQFVWSAIKGKDAIGQEFSLTDWTRWARLFVPITWWTLGESYRKNGAFGVLANTPEAIGINTAIYPERAESATTEAEKLALKIKQMKKPLVDMRGADENIDRETWDKIGALKKRARDGENVRTEVEALKKSGVIPNSIATDILGAGKYSMLEEFLRDGKSTESEIKAVWNLMTDNEKQDLRPFLEKKIRNAEKSGKLDAKTKAIYEEMKISDPTMVDAPAKVKSELERLEIKTPDVGNSLSLKKGEKTKLTEEQFNRYRREVLEKSFAAIERTMALPKFKELDDKYKKLQINRAIAVQRKMVQEKIRNEMRKVH